jgi:glycolate oxidase FAD binding subunit
VSVTTMLSRDAAAALAATGVPIREATAEDAIDTMTPALVASPSGTDQVAAVLRACADHDLALVTRGAGTKLRWGTPPRRLDVLLDVAGLDRIVEHAAGDLIVVAEAGVRMADLNQVLGLAGQQLAVDETAPGATVGGTICAGASGPQRLLRGTARDLLIGLTVVRADGKVVHAGGRVVKNVAGYDVCKLLVGSYGTLGVVTEATFRLHPLPAARRVVSVAANLPADAGKLVARITHSQAVPSAVEIDWPHDGPLIVATMLEGSPAGVGQRAATVAGLAGHGAVVSDTLPWWWARYPWASSDLALKLTFGISGLSTVLACCDALRRDGRLTLALRGSAGTGVLYAAAHPTDASADAVGLAAELLARLRAACAAAGGHVVLVDAPTEVKRAVDVWGPVPGIDLMRRVKAEFDPDRLLAPGRFVGGI